MGKAGELIEEMTACAYEVVAVEAGLGCPPTTTIHVWDTPLPAEAVHVIAVLTVVVVQLLAVNTPPS